MVFRDSVGKTCASHEPAGLPPELVEGVLARLGLARHPEPTIEGLRLVYDAWCRRVPFDNVRKLIHVHERDARPLPGGTAADFFEDWLRFGTGGTCWSGAGALCSLLTALGFSSSRGIGTMLAAPDVPPNHGTVLVRFEQRRYLVDASMLHGEPLRLEEGADSAVGHPAWGVRCAWSDEKWRILWRPLRKVEGLECRLERFEATVVEYQSFYEQTRAWSPFNYELSVRLNRGNDVVGAGFGHAVSLRADGGVDCRPISHADRLRLLIEDIGLSEELVRRLPQDTPTPPPPGSRTFRWLPPGQDFDRASLKPR